MAYIKLNAVVNLAVKLLFSTLLCCRLLVNLTQPTYLCFGSEYPLLQGKEKKDPETVRSFMEVDHYLRDYKDVSSSVENTHTHIPTIYLGGSMICRRILTEVIVLHTILTLNVFTIHLTYALAVKPLCCYTPAQTEPRHV